MPSRDATSPWQEIWQTRPGSCENSLVEVTQGIFTHTWLLRVSHVVIGLGIREMYSYQCFQRKTKKYWVASTWQSASSKLFCVLAFWLPTYNNSPCPSRKPVLTLSRPLPSTQITCPWPLSGKRVCNASGKYQHTPKITHGKTKISQITEVQSLLITICKTNSFLSERFKGDAIGSIKQEHEK
jgi:hypothetical protein